MASSVVEVRGLAPGVSHSELHELFQSVGPIVHLTTVSGRDGKGVSAVVVYETPAAAAQALQYLQNTSLQSPFKLQLQTATQLGASLAGLSQQFASSDLAGVGPHAGAGSLLSYAAPGGLEAGLAALHLGGHFGADLAGPGATGLETGMFHGPPGVHHPADPAWSMVGMGALGAGGMGPALMQAALAQQQRGLGWAAARQRGLLGRPLGKEGASKEPTVKLWLGGVDGTATLAVIDEIFGKFGPLVDKELQQARHERGRTDQWGFVVFKNVADSKAAYEELCGKVILELTGTRRLKLQYRVPDSRRNRQVMVQAS